MAADTHSLPGHRGEGPEEPGPWVKGPGSPFGVNRPDPGQLLPPAQGTDHLTAPVEMVRQDLSRQWHQDLPVNLESPLEAFPELETVETVETVSPEQVMAEDEVSRGSGEAVGGAQLAEQFPSQAEGPRRLIEEQAQEPTKESILGQLSAATAGPQNEPLPLAPGWKAGPIPSRRFGRYRIIEPIGRGAMGLVYLARDTQLGRQVALKVPLLRGEDDVGTPDRRLLERFYREAHAAAILRHPSLCSVYDVGEIDGIPYLTMEYIKGRPLSQYIRRGKPLAPRRAAILVRKLALALRVAHNRGVVHRDLKPSNIMICAGRRPVIMDFGLAWRVDDRNSDARLTRVGSVLGTPAYMSPEQLSGRVEDLGPRCDIYSLGVILYELLTGRCPFDGPDVAILGQVLFIEPDRPLTLRPDLAPGLEAICLKAMAKRPDERYATMGELAAALGEYLRRGARHEPRSYPDPPVEPMSSEARRPEAPVPDRAEPPRGARPRGGPPPDAIVDSPVEVMAAEDLLKTWRLWMATVEAFALGRRSRWLPDEQSFEEMRKRLLAVFRARAAQADGAERAFYQELEQLVLPWVSPKSLARVDREILHELLARYHQAARILGDRPSDFSRAAPWLAAVLLALAGASSLLLWVWRVN